jgi:hypothetical protein
MDTQAWHDLRRLAIQHYEAGDIDIETVCGVHRLTYYIEMEEEALNGRLSKR